MNVNKLYVPLVINAEITKVQIAKDHSLRMSKAHGLNNLSRPPFSDTPGDRSSCLHTVMEQAGDNAWNP